MREARLGVLARLSDSPSAAGRRGGGRRRCVRWTAGCTLASWHRSAVPKPRLRRWHDAWGTARGDVKSVFCVVGACRLRGACSLGSMPAYGPPSPIPPTGIRPCLLPSGPSYRLPSVADGSRRRASRNRGYIPHSKCSKLDKVLELLENAEPIFKQF